jgi:hypothetical protein
VTALAADGNDVAFSAARTKLDCDRVFIWQRLTGRTFQLGKRQRCAPRAAPVDSLAVTGARALWLTSTSGKTVSWQLWTATTTKKTPKLLQFLRASRTILGRSSSVRQAAASFLCGRQHRDGVEVERIDCLPDGTHRAR